MQYVCPKSLSFPVMYLECQEQYSSFKWQNVVMHKFNNSSFSKVKRILWDEWLFKHETVNNYPFHTLSREDWGSLNSRIQGLLLASWLHPTTLYYLFLKHRWVFVTFHDVSKVKTFFSINSSSYKCVFAIAC